jgi:hypothetical protein
VITIALMLAGTATWWLCCTDSAPPAPLAPTSPSSLVPAGAEANAGAVVVAADESHATKAATDAETGDRAIAAKTRTLLLHDLTTRTPVGHGEVRELPSPDVRTIDSRCPIVARADSDGRVELPRSLSSVHLMVLAAGYQAEPVTLGEAETIEVPLTIGHRQQICIRDPAGEPLAACLCVLQAEGLGQTMLGDEEPGPGNPARWPTHVAITDASGIATFEGLPAENFHLHASHGGWAPRQADIFLALPTGSVLQVQLAEPYVVIVAAAQPIPDCAFQLADAIPVDMPAARMATNTVGRQVEQQFPGTRYFVAMTDQEQCSVDVRALLQDGSLAVARLPLWPLRRWQQAYLLNPTEPAAGEVRFEVRHAGESLGTVQLDVHSAKHRATFCLLSGVSASLPAGEYSAEPRFGGIHFGDISADFVVAPGSKQTVQLESPTPMHRVVVTCSMQGRTNLPHTQLRIDCVDQGITVGRQVDPNEWPLTLWLPPGTAQLQLASGYGSASVKVDVTPTAPSPSIALHLRSQHRQQ